MKGGGGGGFRPPEEEIRPREWSQEQWATGALNDARRLAGECREMLANRKPHYREMIRQDAGTILNLVRRAAKHLELDQPDLKHLNDQRIEGYQDESLDVQLELIERRLEPFVRISNGEPFETDRTQLIGGIHSVAPAVGAVIVNLGGAVE